MNQVLNDLEKYDLTQLLIVTKNQTIQDINELISKGFDTFGENKVQEAKKYNFENIIDKVNLHLIGPLQTNKVKDALQIFNTIQSVDREKLINEISKVMKKSNFIKTNSFIYKSI